MCQGRKYENKAMSYDKKLSALGTHRATLKTARAELAALKKREAGARTALEARERRLADLAAGIEDLTRQAGHPHDVVHRVDG